MAGRRFLPALHFLLTGDSAPTEPETKTISWSGGGAYTSTMYAGTGNMWGTGGRADGWDMDRVVTEGYERVVWVFKAVDTIGKHASRLPLELGRGLTEEGEFDETFPDHPLLRLLNGRANPLETGPMFREHLSGQILLSKRGVFVEKTHSRAGTLTRLDLGSEYAGHLSVIAGVDVVRTAGAGAAKPRAMNYEHASANAKLEILAAFGAPESVTGNASGRTAEAGGAAAPARRRRQGQDKGQQQHGSENL
ncbi:hypothetical protein AB0H82_10915 [Streptomyces sp. NPDC050732]|uniref:hypothetical protein n=1 Tax=Streptomyces sp. NPDC050732 TaxID=3154632 RepID=UPI0034227A36